MGYGVPGVAVRVAVGVAVRVGGVPVMVGVEVPVAKGCGVGDCVAAGPIALPLSFKRAMLVKGLLE